MMEQNFHYDCRIVDALAEQILIAAYNGRNSKGYQVAVPLDMTRAQAAAIKAVSEVIKGPHQIFVQQEPTL